MSDVPLIRPSEVARFWALHPRTVNEWIRTGRLAAVRTPGEQFRLRAADVIAFCEREKMRVPTFVFPVAKRAYIIGGTDVLARSLAHEMRGSGVKLERGDDALSGVVACTFSPPTVIAIDAKLPDRFAERAARSLDSAPLDPRPSIVVFDVANAAKCGVFADAGAAYTVTRARRADLAKCLVEIANG